LKISIDVIKSRLAEILDSKSQNEKRINELTLQAKILKKRLQIDDKK